MAGKAKPDDVLVRLICRCEGAVLVAAYAAEDWQCPVCREVGIPTARTTLREHVIDGGIPTAVDDRHPAAHGPAGRLGLALIS